MKDPTMSLPILVQFGLSQSHRSPMNHPMAAQFGPSRSHRNPKVYRKLDWLTLYQRVKAKHARLVMKRLNGVHPISSIWDIAIQNYTPNQKVSPVHKFQHHRLRNLLDWVSYFVFHFLYDATLVVVQWIASADSCSFLFSSIFLKHVNELSMCESHAGGTQKNLWNLYYFINFRRRPQDLAWRIFCRKCSSYQKEGTHFKIRNQARNCGGSQGGKQ